jgi:dephospho-CoA kinase
MKSFLELVEETKQGEKHHAMTFGRMNPPTTGHLKLINKVKDVASKQNASHSVVVSHSQDSKKNPLTGTQKLKHLKRYSPDTNFKTSSKEHPTILHHAAELHKKGVTHLHMVVGSDRVKEMHHLLHKYNDVKAGHGHYNFKKITVHSAGHRDPDAEGSEGMSGTKMRAHAKDKDVSSFRKGVPSHVSHEHAKELMHDVRKGMGLHEDVERGQFKAIFVTGGPGSGKDIVIREAIAESRIVELNFIQARDYLGDKQKLSEKTSDFRREAVRSRGPLIINGPADDIEKITYIKEELEELGYETMMIFVHTNNETSQQRNSNLTRMMAESIRQDKWQKSQQNITLFDKIYDNLVTFDNTGNLDTKEEDINDIYESTKLFLDTKSINEFATDWLNKNGKDLNNKINWLFGEQNVKQNSRSIQQKTIGKYSFQRAKGPADIKPDNSGSLVGDRDQISGNTGPRKDPNGRGHSGGAWHGVYSTESVPTLKINPPAKEPNFEKDNNKEKIKKRGDRSLSAGRVFQPAGIGSTYDTRAGGQGAAAGAGLGQNLYGESQDYSNAQPSSAAIPGSSELSPNPLSSSYDTPRTFEKFRKKIKKEAIDDPGAVDMGVGGVLNGATNKEPVLYPGLGARVNLIGVEIKKKKKLKEDYVKELEVGLHKLNNHSYNSIDKLMQGIAKKHGITGKDLHDEFKKKHNKIPDEWIKQKKC